eukprot:CFRG7173T1
MSTSFARRTKKPKAVRRRLSNSDDDDHTEPTTTLNATVDDSDSGKLISDIMTANDIKEVNNSAIALPSDNSASVSPAPDSEGGAVLKKRGKKKKKDIGTGVSMGVISFGAGEEEEEEGETFQIKKSSASRRVAKQLRTRKTEGQELPIKRYIYERNYSDTRETKMSISVPLDAVSTGSSGTGYYTQSGEYTKERLQVMRSQTPSTHTSTPTSVQRGTYIPDARTIHEARKRREKMRDGQDYIPLNDHNGTDGDGHTQSTERAFADEDETRIEFGDTEKIQSRKKRQEMEAALLQHTDHGSDSAFRAKPQGRPYTRDSKGDESDSDDDEIARWESEQMRKGAGQGKGPVSWGNNQQPSIHSTTLSSVQMQQQQARMDIPQLSSNTPVTIEQVVDRLTTTIQNVTVKYNEDDSQLRRTKDSLQVAVDRIGKLSQSNAEAKQTYNYFSSVRSFLGVLIDCLDEKVPLIVNCEAKMHTIIKTMADAKIQCRREDTQMRMVELDSVAPGHNFGQKFTSPFDTDKTGGAMRTKPMNASEKAEMAKQLRVMAQRVTDRRASKKSFNETVGQKVQHHAEGLSSADEYPDIPDLSDLANQSSDVVDTAGKIFADVDDMYSTLPNIQRRLEKWKATHPLAYKDAYVSDCAPHLFAPFVRLKLLQWNPLEEGQEVDAGVPTLFEGMDWFISLLEYGPPTSEEDPDALMIPTLLALTLVPKALGFIGHVWDVHSTKQTKRLLSLLHTLSEYPVMDPSDSAMPGAKVRSDISKAVLSRVSEFTTKEVCIPIVMASELQRFGIDQRRVVISAMERQCCVAVKIAVNSMSLNKYASVVGLKDEIVDELLNSQLLPAWEILGPTPVVVSLVVQIAEALPSEWLKELAEMEELSQLSKLRTCVNSLFITGKNGSGDRSNTSANVSENTCATNELSRIRALLYNIKL